MPVQLSVVLCNHICHKTFNSFSSCEPSLLNCILSHHIALFFVFLQICYINGLQNHFYFKLLQEMNMLNGVCARLSKYCNQQLELLGQSIFLKMSVLSLSVGPDLLRFPSHKDRSRNCQINKPIEAFPTNS